MELKFNDENGRAVSIHVRVNVVSLALGDSDVLTFDREGRPVTAVLDGHTFRRGLDGRVLQKWREPAGDSMQRRRRWLAPAEASILAERIESEVRGAARASARLARGGFPEAAEIAAELERIGRFGVAALERDAEQFSRVYRPVTILPPDQYLSLVLQITEGCAYNRCTFCGFYRDRPFRAKDPAEIAAHVAEVVRFLGAGITLRRSVFLADANALCLPQERLLPMLEAVNAGVVPALGRSSAGICSFVDMFSDRERAAQDYAEMRRRNVRRVYVGIETGSGSLLKFLKKPQTPEQAVRTIATIKKGGLGVGAIVMLGIGGREYDRQHVDGTVELLNSIPWTPGDAVFLSEFVEFPGIEYPDVARKAGLHPLDAEDMARQYLEIASGIRRFERLPKIAPYNAEEFIY